MLLDRAMGREIKPFIQRWSVYLVAMELIGAALAHFGMGGRFDFRSFYAAGYLARTQPRHLYDLAHQLWAQQTLVSPKGFLPFYHPPYEALLYAPFTLLSYQHAYFAFLAFNMLLLVGAFFAARQVFSTPIKIWQPQPGAMFFIFVPMLVAAMQGQDSILFLFLCCLAWKQLEAGKDLSAGVLLALALFKFQIAIPIAVLVAIRKGRRFFTGFLATASLLVLLCFGIAGRSGIASLIRILFGAVSATDQNHALLQNGMGIYPSAMPNIAGLFYACGGRFLPALVSLTVVAVCSLGLFLWCARAVREAEEEVAFSIAILCGLLVSYHAIIHDVTLMLLPMALLARRTHSYILLALFGLPIVLLPFGSNAFFVLAVPVIAMLVHAVLSGTKLTKVDVAAVAATSA